MSPSRQVLAEQMESLEPNDDFSKSPQWAPLYPNLWFLKLAMRVTNC